MSEAPRLQGSEGRLCRLENARTGGDILLAIHRQPERPCALSHSPICDLQAQSPAHPSPAGPPGPACGRGEGTSPGSAQGRAMA